MKLKMFFLVLILASCNRSNTHRYSKVVLEPWAFIDSHFYIIEHDSLTVIDSMNKVTSFVKKLSEKELKEYDHCLTVYNLDTLPKRYANQMMDDGNNLEIHLINNSQRKHIWITNYYLKEVTPLIGFVNQIVPDSLDIYYPKKDELFDYTDIKTVEVIK